jgi:hypothetical protein
MMPNRDNAVVDLPTQHIVAGDTSRFRHGPTELAPNTAWREDLPASVRATVTALTFPMLHRYGYN